jgi:subtilisin family serine protease
MSDDEAAEVRGQRPNQEPERPRSRAEAQLQLILQAFGEAAETDPPRWEDPAEVTYIYRRGSILVRDRDLDRVLALFDGRGAVHGGLISGLTRYEPPSDFDFPDDVPEAPSLTLRFLAYVDLRLGPGVVTPDHLVYVVPGDVSPCPATEPEEVPAGAPPFPAVSIDRCDGRGVKVVVVDVGWSPAPGVPWLAGVTGEIEDAFLPPPDGTIRPYAGHGTFIAGVVRTMAPKAEVVVKGVFTVAGATWESELVVKLDEALAESPDVISLSAGTRTRNDLSSLGFDVFYEERLSRVKGLLLVAAAGNDGNRGPFFPAATPGTVGVGALAKDWTDRASFSNHGGWVDVYAPGTDLVNAYLTGTFRCEEPPHRGQLRVFHGIARWSGTSFATPLVTGLIAARMSVTGENAKEAAHALLHFARTQAIAGVGAILLPGQACAALQHPQRRGCLPWPRRA